MRVALNLEQCFQRPPGGIGRYAAELARLLPEDRLTPGEVVVVPFVARHSAREIATLPSGQSGPRPMPVVPAACPRRVLYELWNRWGRADPLAAVGPAPGLQRRRRRARAVDGGATRREPSVACRSSSRCTTPRRCCSPTRTRDSAVASTSWASRPRPIVPTRSSRRRPRRPTRSPRTRRSLATASGRSITVSTTSSRATAQVEAVRRGARPRRALRDVGRDARAAQGRGRARGRVRRRRGCRSPASPRARRAAGLAGRESTRSRGGPRRSATGWCSRDRWRPTSCVRCTAAPTCSRSRAATRDSASPCSRRWRRRRPCSAPTCRCCARSRATLRSTRRGRRRRVGGRARRAPRRRSRGAARVARRGTRARRSTFTWERSAAEHLEVYRSVQ